MAQLSTSGRVLIVAAAAGAVFLAWRSAKASQEAKKKAPLGPVIPPSGGDGGPTPSGTREPDQQGKKGSGKINPGKNNEGPPPLPEGWGGGQYGPGPVPVDFDWNGNLLFVSEDCQTIAEPLKFLPKPGTQEVLSWWMPVNGGPSAQAPLAIALGWLVADEQGNPITGTAWGYIARMVATKKRWGEPLDEEAIEEICLLVWEEMLVFQAVMPNCPSPLDEAAMKNSPAFKKWWRTFVDRVKFGINKFKSNWYVWNPLWEEQ